MSAPSLVAKPGPEGESDKMMSRTARWESAERYYELYEGEDLFGWPVLVQVWGGKGSRRGGQRTVLATTPSAVDALKEEIAKRRRRHGYSALTV